MVTLDAPPPAYDEGLSQLDLTLTADPSGKDVLITVKPPAAPATPDPKPEQDEKEDREQLKAKRAPVDFVLTIDVSGSMATEAPVPGENERTGLSVLDVVKHAANTIIITMKPEDRIAIVSFTGKAKVVLPLTHTNEEGKAKALKEVKSLRPLDSTNLWDGLKQSMNILTEAPPATDPESPGGTIASLAAAGGAIAAAIASTTMDTPVPKPQYGNPKHRLSSIFLLTDGLPNVEPPRGHILMLKLYLESQPSDKTKFTINTFGFGYTLDSKLLNDIAKIGNGHFGFIADSGIIGTNFVHAVANTYATYAEGLFVDIEIDDSQVAKEMEVLGSFEVNKASWGVQVPLGQLQYGQTRDVVIRLPRSLPKSPVTVTARCRPWDSDDEVKTTRVISDAHVPPSENATDPALLYQSFRLEFVSTVHKEIAATGSNPRSGYVRKYPVPPDAATTFKDLASRIHGAFPGEKPAEPSVNSDALDLAEDISGQILLGIADGGAFNKWGLHYLLSLSRSHQRQQCGNFKDPGLQPYGRDSVLFRATRDEIDTTFDNLPPPEPSLSVSPYSVVGGAFPPAAPTAAPAMVVGMSARLVGARGGGVPPGSGRARGRGATFDNLPPPELSLSVSPYSVVGGAFPLAAPTAALAMAVGMSSRLVGAQGGGVPPGRGRERGRGGRGRGGVPSAASGLFASSSFLGAAGPVGVVGAVVRPATVEMGVQHPAFSLSALSASRGGRAFSMSAYNSPSAPCFAGSSIIELSDGENVPVEHLLVGSSVKTPLGSAKVIGIVKTSSPDGSFDLCKLGDGLLITPWHPVYVSEEGTWRFPADIVAPRQTACNSVYSLILEENQDSDGHAVFIGGIRCVTMGHGVVDPADVRSHPFLANHFSVMQALQAHPDFAKGLVDAVETIKDTETGLMCGFMWKQDLERSLNALPEIPSVLLDIEARSLTVEA
ncbi:hypothetical protein FRC04_008953 [Tulasnella sp. 424]|nr:hypothetical protein FRC04_008953 [Tulasnella sp. 424]KAG8973610.1 hypothetical protein FRC05_008546 [Tulasnella sp. 425]